MKELFAVTEEQLADESYCEYLFQILQAEGHDKTLPNLSEFMLERLADQNKPKSTVFWFRASLRYLERVMPE